MSEHLVPRVSVATGIAAAVVAYTMSGALAAGDCQAQPTRQPSAGGHWYYHFDSVSGRKCWYMAESRSSPPSSGPPTADAAPSFLASLKTRLFGDASVQPQPAPATANASASAPPSAGDPRTRRHILHVPHRTPVEEKAEGSAAPLTEAQRDLFQQFLEWRARQILE